MARVHARHILVHSLPACEQIREELARGEPFQELARRYSHCPSGRQGGDLGEFGPGEMVREFDQAVFSANAGEVVGPVHTEFGYHLIEIVTRAE